MMTPGNKLILSLWLICCILLSITVIAPWAASPERSFAKAVAESADGKITAALELTAASTAASLAVSALPGDTATPIAEKLADFGKGFLLVLCVLYFEKTIYSVLGYGVFALIIPAALFLLLLSLFRQKRLFRTFALCTAGSAVLFWLMIPCGLLVSDLVYTSQQEVIQETIQSSGDLSMEIEEGTVGGEAEGKAGVEEAENQNVLQRMITTVSSFSAEMVAKAKKLTTAFLSSLALMIVTTCIIPAVILLFFLWVIKLLFQLGLSVMGQETGLMEL